MKWFSWIKFRKIPLKIEKPIEPSTPEDKETEILERTRQLMTELNEQLDYPKQSTKHPTKEVK
jgi:hypothetical protein